ncbi:MAG: hypothetical protein FWH10_06285 [Oscillospiraceae bacterium]|nr:hypothetical protein [Oscillospiraceae bacterium]
MKDTKESSLKLSDLFDELQETINKSPFNSPDNPEDGGDETNGAFRDGAAVSELFDMINSKNTDVPDFTGGEPDGRSRKSSPVESFMSRGREDIYRNEDVKETREEITKIRETEDFEISGVMDDSDDSGETDDIDLELLKAIGIGKASGYYPVGEKENDRTPGKKNPREAKERGKSRGDVSPAEKSKTRLTPIHQISNREYSGSGQVQELFASYRRVCRSEFAKFAVSLILFLILLYMETAPYIGFLPVPNVLNIDFYTLPYIYVNLQLLLIAAALNLKPLIYGALSAAKSNINVYSMSCLFFILAFAHTMLTLYMRDNGLGIALYNSTAVYAMLLSGLYNILDMNSEITSLKTISSKKLKYAVSLNSAVRAENSAYYSSPELETELFRDIFPSGAFSGGIFKTQFISNFFSRTNRNKTLGGSLKYFVYTALFAAAVLLAFYALFYQPHERNWYGFLSSAAVLLLGSLPLCSFITEVYPAFKAQKQARMSGAAFIGAESLRESAETKIISLYDNNIFPSEQVKISGIKVYGNNRIDSVLQNLCVIFDKLNMPPADTFKASTNFDGGFNQNIKISGIDDNGICYDANGQKLFLGTVEYISNMGLTPQYDANFDDPFVKSSGSIMILSSETEIIAKVYIKYEITSDFHDIIKNIKKINACLCIRTFDPNINDALISKLGNIKKYPIRVLKLKNPGDIQLAPERVDSPVVSRESVKSLVGAVSIAVRTRSIIKNNGLIRAVAFGCGIILAAALGFTGHLWGVNAGHLFLFQSFWMLPVILMQGVTN